ncbi:hypothetical protein DL93DRAFT_148283 [Clavulina sp. PMI_390]|nr:hypothetical protein DL93DRAFT_148283 [Clavulina sp. PMI_390]
MADRRQRSSGRKSADNKPYVRAAAPEGSWKHDKAAEPTDTVAISNLHYEVMPSDLKTIFEAIGTLAREPVIKYDRSGRSLGVGFVQFAKLADAKVAIQRLDGVSAKGKPMNIAFDQKRPAKGGPTPTGPKNSLLTRIASAPLVNRVAKSTNDADVPGTAPKDKAPRAPRQPRKGGAAAGGKGDAGGAQKKSKPARVPKLPATAEDLDKELQAYLEEDKTGGAAPATTAAAGSAAPQDVEMA